MPGPVPSEVKRRRNKPKIVPLAVPPGAFSGTTPELPNAENYSARTQAWYQSWRESEQAPTFTKTAWLTLWMLAELVDLYWLKPTPAAWAQIKQTQTGLLALPADQRRVGFKVEPPKPAVVPSPAGVASLADRRARLIANAK
jgi:hypothetical protein